MEKQPSQNIEASSNLVKTDDSQWNKKIEGVRFAADKKEAEKSPDISTLKEFYENIKNPIQDDAVITDIIEAYSHENEGSGGLYGALSGVGIDEKETGKIIVADKKQFEEKMFNRWRKSVVDMTEQEFLLANQSGSLGSDFRFLHNFVKSHPELSTNHDLRTAIDGMSDKTSSNKMFDILEKYSWDFGEPEWRHVKSRNVNAKQEDRIEVDHRFYLNTDSTDTYAMVDALVDTYEKNDLPYYFKFNESGHRADTIVIYTSTKDLIKNLDVLKQVQQEYPELANRLHQPPILTGKIGEKIGYGAEPEKSSYNDVNETTLSWVEQHKNDVIRCNGKEMVFSEYLIDNQVKFLQEKMRNQLDWKVENKKRILKHQGQTTINVSAILTEMEQEVGYTQTDLQDNSKMLQAIKYRLIPNFELTLQVLEDPSGNINNANIIMNARNGKQITVKASSLKTAMEKIAPQIPKHDQSYIQDIKHKIMKHAIAAGIDDKFCFDVATVKKMKAQSRQDYLLMHSNTQQNY